MALLKEGVLIFVVFLVFTPFCVDTNGDSYPFRDPSLPWSQRVDDLVNRLTLEEIVNQTFVSNREGKGIQSVAPAISRLGINPFVWKTDCTRGSAHTNATAFPQDIGLAASFRYLVSITYRPSR